MAEPRRLALETDKIKNVEKKPVEVPPTLRFNLSLSESNDRTCPELSYPELVRNAMSEYKEKDPYGEEDDHDRLAALARKFEEKYNPGPRLGNKKGRRKKFAKMEDFMDLGMGYDETDSFVDNTEAYDELVPSTLTTQHGGFYINSGELKFRDVNSESDDDDDDDDQDSLDYEKKRRGKRAKHLARECIDKEKRRKKLALGTKDGELLSRRRKLDSLAKSALKPKKKSQPTVANLIQQREKARHTVLTAAPSTSTGPFSNNGSGDNSAPNGQLAHSPLTDLSLSPDGRQIINSGVTEAIESVINASLEAAPTEAEAVKDGNAGVGSPQSAPKLPSGLPSELEVLVEQIKQAAKESEDGKCKFFSPAVNNMLLMIEMQSRELHCGQRSSLYAHLGAHLPCSKETLMKRAKKLRLDKEDGKLKEPMQKLKEAIGRVMPQLLDKYTLECQAAVQARSSTEKETEDSNDAEGSDSDEEEKPEQPADDKTRRPGPRKKFEWNDEIRYLLCDVVKIKMKCFELYKSRQQTAEEYLRQFLETEVKELWPKGWMQARSLFKESRVVHAAFTSIFPKPKKLTVAPKKILPPSVPPNIATSKLIAATTAITTTSVPTIISTTATTSTITSVLSTTNVSPLFILPPSSSSGNPSNFFRSMLTASYANTTVANTSSTTTVTSTVSAINPSMSTNVQSSTITQSPALISRSQPILTTTVYVSPISVSKNITSAITTTTSSSTLPMKSIPSLLSVMSTTKNPTITTQSVLSPTVSPITSSKSCSATAFTSAVSFSRNPHSSTFASSSASISRNSSSTLTSLITSAPKSILITDKSITPNTLISNTKTTPSTSPSSLEFMSRLMSGVHYHPPLDTYTKLPAVTNIMRFASTASQSILPPVSSLHQSQQTSTSHSTPTRTVTSPQDKLLKSKSPLQDSLYVKPKISSTQDHSNKPKVSSLLLSPPTSLLSNMNSYKPEQEKNLTKFLTSKTQQTLSSEGTKISLQSVRPASNSLSDALPTATSQNYVSSPTTYLTHNSIPSTSSNQHKTPSHSSSNINLGLSANHATLADLASQAEQVYPAHFQTSPLKTEACQRSSQGQSSQWGSPIYMNKLLVPVTTTLPGYQSLSLPDLTKSSNTAVRPHNSHTILIPSSDAIITGPAPGTFTHGQSLR